MSEKPHPQCNDALGHGMEAVIFDYDGVLMDSEPFHRRAARQAAQRLGLDVEPADFDSMPGRTDEVFFRELAVRRGWTADVGRVMKLKDALFAGAFAPRSFPGARELVEALARVVPLAVASNSHHAEVESGLRALKMRMFFAGVVGGDRVSRPKPHPEIYGAAAAALGVSVANVAIVEDSLPGIEAGLSAGAGMVIGVAHSMAPEQLRRAQLVVDNFLPAGRAAILAALWPGGSRPLRSQEPASRDQGGPS